jgi:hypothetical protein
MAHEAGWMAEYIRTEKHKIVLIAQDGEDDYGWWTTQQEKIDYAYAANSILSVGNIAYSKDLICSCPWWKGDKVKKVKDLFELQLPGYSPKLKPDSTTDGKNDLAFNLTFNLRLYQKFLARKLSGLHYETLMK